MELIVIQGWLQNIMDSYIDHLAFMWLSPTIIWSTVETKFPHLEIFWL